MRSRIEIVAELRNGRSTVTAIRGGGHFAGRQTGPDEVYLVGTAAGPLGGDDVTIALHVGPGARLQVRSAAATVVLPGLEQPDSRLRIEARVDDDALLVLEPEPTVVCAQAVHAALTEVTLHGSGQARVREQVVLGRSGEPGGEWAGRTVVTRDDAPVLRHTLRSQLLGGPDGPVRGVASLIDTGLEGVAATAGSSVAMPLTAGGLLVTGTGRTATAVLAELEGALAASTAGTRPAGTRSDGTRSGPAAPLGTRRG